MRFQFLNSPIDLIEDGDTTLLEVHCCPSCGHVDTELCDCYWVNYNDEPLDDHEADQAR